MYNCWRLEKRTFLWRPWRCPNIMNQWINVSCLPIFKTFGDFQLPCKENDWTSQHHWMNKIDSLKFTGSNSMLIPIFAMSSCLAWTQCQWIVHFLQQRNLMECSAHWQCSVHFCQVAKCFPVRLGAAIQIGRIWLLNSLTAAKRWGKSSTGWLSGSMPSSSTDWKIN